MNKKPQKKLLVFMGCISWYLTFLTFPTFFWWVIQHSHLNQSIKKPDLANQAVAMRLM